MDAFILWGIGLFFIVMGILAIKNSSKCNTKIRAVYVDYAVIKVRNGGKMYFPVFRYRYNGQQYEEKTFQNFSKRYIHSTYQEGMEYDIYIDIENPKRFRVVQKFDFICLVLLVIGIFFFLGGFIPMKELFGMI